jgi:hypothetical protein
MIADHSSFKHPANLEIKIWRYMDLAKFVSLLLNRALHFARADKLGDPFEGSITRVQYEMRDHIIANRHSDPRLVAWRSMSNDALQKLFSMQSELNRKFPSHCFINCWHMNEHESAAMWRLYSQADEAVCIQSTFNRLAGALPSYVQAGEVSYFDYETGVLPIGNIFNAFLCKRASFSHEREIRAMVLTAPPESNLSPPFPCRKVGDGLQIEIDLVQLVEAIYVSPASKAWFKEIVEQLVAGKGLTMPVLQSALSSAPLF